MAQQIRERQDGFPPCQEAYDWGLQGPDILFFGLNLLHGMHTNRAGSIMHKQKLYRLFEELVRYAKRTEEQEKAILMSYLSGFVCHYVLDKSVHPYIYYSERQRDRERPGTYSSHHQLESDLDTLLLRQEGLTLHDFRPNRTLIRDKEMLQAIAKLYRHVLYRVYGMRVSISAVVRCFYNAFRFTSILLGRGEDIRPLLAIGEEKFGHAGLASSLIRRSWADARVLNLEHREWHNLNFPDIPRNESVPEILLSAQEEAVIRIGILIRNLEEDGYLAVNDQFGFDNGSPQ